MIFFFFFFNDTATTEIYTLSLHDALPISRAFPALQAAPIIRGCAGLPTFTPDGNFLVGQVPSIHGLYATRKRSEEHTSELQSRSDLVCRLLLEKKKTEETAHIPSCTTMIY